MVRGGDGSIAVAWKPADLVIPSAEGVWKSLTYIATALPGGATCTTSGATSCTIDGLTNGRAYTVTVVGVYNWFSYSGPVVGETPASDPSASAMPRVGSTVPGAPSRPSVTAGPRQIDVEWGAPITAGGSDMTRYTATAQPGGATCTTTGAIRCTIVGLNHDIQYTVTVSATNTVGTGPASDASDAVAPVASAPDAPRTPVARNAPGQIDVDWVAPASDGGSTITGYTATAQPGGATCTTTGTTGCTITGLDDATQYTVTVTATNDAGTGLPATAVVVTTPPVAPSAPRSPQVTALPGRIDVVWLPPTSSGGSEVTGYTATAQPGGASCATTGATECTITGLVNGTTYTVTVVASNVAGPGPGSAPSDTATPKAATSPLRPASGEPGEPSGIVLVPEQLGTPSAPVPGAGSPSGTPSIVGFNLTPRTLVPGIGSSIAYTLSEPAAVTLTFTFDRGRTAGSRVVFRIAAGRAGATAGSSRLRLLYSRASARTKRAGTWKVRIEARTAHGAVSAKTLSIKVKTAA